MRRTVFTSLILAATMMLGACQPRLAPLEEPKNYMLDCQWETDSKGSYKQSFEKIGTNGLPTVLPDQGGNIRGALLMNEIGRAHV